ncbi:MAG: glycosyltransferase [Terriglobales bacterium]
MARILTCWEMGNGLAYIEGITAAGRVFRKAGHEVQFALRDLSHAERLQGGKFTFYQAPTQVLPSPDLVRNPMSFADVLINLGFGRPANVTARVRAWRALLDLVKPDIVRCVHAPGALLAARGTSIRSLAVGIGFLIPPPISPLPNLRGWDKQANTGHMLTREQLVLDGFNQALKAIGAPPVASVGALYAEADVCELYTYPELDDYGPRSGVRYHGNFQPGIGEAPVWPAGSGKRIFAYLEKYKSLPGVLKVLAASGNPVLVYMAHPPEELLKQYATGNLRIAMKPLNIPETAAQCDIGVSQGGHNIAGSFLMAGKPQLCLPALFPEAVTAGKVFALGAGISSSMLAQDLQPALSRLLQDTVMARKAAEYGASVRSMTPEFSIQGALETVEELAKAGPRRV